METSPKRKILFVITKSNFGGAQHYVYDIATHLSDFDVVVAHGGHGKLEEMLKNAGLRTVHIGELERDVGIFKDFRVFFRLKKLFKEERPHTIHLNSSKIGGLGSLAGRFVGVKKIVFTAHGWAYREDRSPAAQLTIKFLSWLTILFSHKIIVLSEFEKKCAPTRLMQKKVVAIYNGISNIEILPTKEGARESLGEHISLPSDSIWVGTVAELHKNKGIDYLIDAFAEIKKDNTYLIIIGEGEEKSTLNEKIHTMSLHNNVFLLGNIPNAWKYFKAFDIFALTSIKEGFPYTLLEAARAELPVIASNVGGIPELLNYGKAGLLTEPKNVAQIKAHLETLIMEPGKRATYGSLLKKYTDDHFTFEEMLNKTKALYS